MSCSKKRTNSLLFPISSFTPVYFWAFLVSGHLHQVMLFWRLSFFQARETRTTICTLCETLYTPTLSELLVFSFARHTTHKSHQHVTPALIGSLHGSRCPSAITLRVIYSGIPSSKFCGPCTCHRCRTTRLPYLRSPGSKRKIRLQFDCTVRRSYIRNLVKLPPSSQSLDHHFVALNIFRRRSKRLFDSWQH